MRISSIFPHHGEEPPVSGTGGSGTVFFSHCTLRCIFCQNYQISHDGEGERYLPEDLARRCVGLQDAGCHNINLVTPGHYLPWILEALREAAAGGLHIPVVYNCGGYETGEALGILDGVVDIYLPDMKYGGDEAALQYSNAPDYVAVNRRAVREMFRQVGPLRVDARGVARRGLIVRHLVLPGGEAGSESVREFLAATFDPHDIAMSVMAQYRPLYRARECAAIDRRVTAVEYAAVRDAFIRSGFEGYYQEIESLDSSFVIDFRERKFERLDGKQGGGPTSRASFSPSGS
jgi:putative pyruvate formate lyase activating enzyme